MTLVELLVAMGILAFISISIYSAIDGMRRSREAVERITDRYREGRMAMARMTRELESAYLSEHAPIDPSLRVVKTVFIAKRENPAARIDFNSFARRRLGANERMSDQMEVSYFGSDDPDRNGVTDLARREASPDEKPTEGGKVEVLATNIDLFEVEFLDPATGQWVEEWDSTSGSGEKGRLPFQAKLTLVLNDGARKSEDSSRGKIRLVTKVNFPIQDTLNFALK
jgi:general secretion pathway protein J